MQAFRFAQMRRARPQELSRDRQPSLCADLGMLALRGSVTERCLSMTGLIGRVRVAPHRRRSPGKEDCFPDTDRREVTLRLDESENIGSLPLSHDHRASLDFPVEHQYMSLAMRKAS